VEVAWEGPILFLFHALDRADVSLVAPVIATQPLFVFLLSALLLGQLERRERSTIVGGWSWWEGRSSCRCRAREGLLSAGYARKEVLGVASHEIVIDRRRPVEQQPDRCHNPWHPDIPPVLTCAPGDDVLIETRDAVDGQLTPRSSHEDVVRMDRSIVHPLTGPVAVEGAEPGDAPSVEVIEVVPASFGYSAQIPGFGFLAAEFPDPFLVRWDIEGGYATSRDLPGVRIPGAPFMGTIGVAPSRDLLEQATLRERSLSREVDGVLLPDRRGAVPATEPIASEGLRTKPPRENGGNLDVRQMVAGTQILFPEWQQDALFSAGDAHFA
jgi:formamidase